MLLPSPRENDLAGPVASANDRPVPPPGLETLLGLLVATRPSWMRDALCQEHPEVSWFVDRGESSAPAKAICGRCLVMVECRSWALEQGAELAGIWGGTTAQQRRKMRAADPALRPRRRQSQVLERPARAGARAPSWPTARAERSSTVPS